MKQLFLVRLSLIAAAAAVVPMSGLVAANQSPAGSARLHARPHTPIKPAQIGRHPLGLEKSHDGWLSVPPDYRASSPVPLILMLHGARGPGGLEQFCDMAAKLGIAVVVPESRGTTWDIIQSREHGFGPDITFIDHVLAMTFSSVAIDPRHIAIAGFSDGASYALSVGLANGDLFTHVIGYSPGGMSPPDLRGRPSIFITQGIRDRILPIATSSRPLVLALRRAGYRVVYKQFDGGHTIKREIAEESFRWFLQ
jgi:predicted esterase